MGPAQRGSTATKGQPQTTGKGEKEKKRKQRKEKKQKQKKNTGPEGHTPAPPHYASATGHVDVVRRLLKKAGQESRPGEVVNAQDKHRSTPFYIASAAGHVEVVKILIPYKPNRNNKSRLQKTEARELYKHSRWDGPRVDDKFTPLTSRRRIDTLTL